MKLQFPKRGAILWMVWLMMITGGMLSLDMYKSSPGASADAPKVWPADSALARIPGTFTLVMMSHPRCPCTRASITELAELMAQFGTRVTAYVLFVQPDGVDAEWTKTDLWRSASRIAGVRTLRDDHGTEAARFEGLTSGTVVLYDAEGQLRFTGGITGARGHVGNNLGLERVMSLLGGTEPDRTDSPVFGCPLHTPDKP